MGDDSFDLDELDRYASQTTTTAWASQVAGKMRGPRTYSRRGSTGALPRKGLTYQGATPMPTELPAERLSPEEDEFGEWGEDRALPSFKRDASTIPGRRRFTKAHSISGVSHHVVPKRAPQLQRSQSISDSSRSSSSRSFSSRSTAMASMRSSSVSSSIDSLPDFSENRSPNYRFDGLEENVSPKRGARPLNLRGRKKVRSARNLGGSDHAPLRDLPMSSSFSNLARHGEDGLSWAKSPPPPSVMSPFPPKPPLLNDFDFTEFTESSPALSVGSRRKRGICESPFDELDDSSSAFAGFSVSRPSNTRSRSRLLSPPVTRMPEFPDREGMLEFSMNYVKAKKKITREMDIASDDGDTEGDNSGDDASVESAGNKRSPMPTFVPHEQRQKRSSSVTTFCDALFGSSALQPETAHVDDVIGSMTSYPDLKFLTKSLRRQQGGSRVNWNVATPNAWVTERRAAFLQWTKTTLGFSVRNAGGGANYIQISKSKGAGILKLLESTLSACLERGIGGRTPTNEHDNKKTFTFAGVSGIHELARASRSLALTPKELTCNSWRPFATTPVEIDALDGDLLESMMAMGMDDKSSLVQQDFPVKSSIIFEDMDDVSMYDPSRQSLENHSSSRDLMAHMHGETPVPRKGRPLRLSLQSIGSVGTAGTASKYNAASPFPQSRMNAIGSHMKCISHDFVETPMMKPQDQGWGCCPRDGRDWGSSEPCEGAFIEELSSRFEQSRKDAGFFDSPCGESDSHMEGPRPTAFGLDLESASGYREMAESPESVSNEESPDTGLFQAGLVDLSPSANSPIDKMDTVPDRQVIFEDNGTQTRALRRRQTSFAKHRRMSLFASAVNPAASIINSRKSLFVLPPRSNAMSTEPIRLERLGSQPEFRPTISEPMEEKLKEESVEIVLDSEKLLQSIFVFLQEPELLRIASLVCTNWADAATHAHAHLMLMSVGCEDTEEENDEGPASSVVPGLMERSWQHLTSKFPWACFLSDGAFKQVYKVFNHTHRVEEALSVMDVEQIESTGNKQVIGTELAVSVMLSSLVRRGVCPNFVVTRGVFSCPFKPPERLWGTRDNKRPKGDSYVSPKAKRAPKEPKKRGRFQYIRMELCDAGDAEEFLKEQPNQALLPGAARQIIFQITFALHAAAGRFSLKHYDVKLLNVFLKRMSTEKSGNVVMRYGLGQHMFALRSRKEHAIVAKLADYGTANVDAGTNGQQVTIAQYTTLENTPPDFLILGDKARQGHGHDNFGLGLCMLHLFTGHAPYEEILESIICPENLKHKLRHIWECEDETEYSVIRSVVLSEVYKDEEGHIIEGEPDETLYDTFYKFLVLLGIPKLPPQLQTSKVWVAVQEALEGNPVPGGSKKHGKKSNRKPKNDVTQYTRDCRKYSLSHGNNEYVSRARAGLESLEGGMPLLYSLCSFDPQQRATPLDVLNSNFMAALREDPRNSGYSDDDEVHSYTAFSTQF